MRFWLIAIWQTIPRRWLVIAAPVVLPLLALAVWWLFGGFFYTPPDPSMLAARAEMTRLLPIAQNGDRTAMVKLGALYRDGTAGKIDGAQAAQWFAEAVKRGDGDAHVALGDLYAQGLGVRRDYARAAELYRAAAGLGRNVEAQYRLGDLYAYGRGVPNDYAIAIDWFRKAALAGHAGAQAAMGAFYENGFGTDRNLIEAYVWYSLAAEHAARAAADRPDIDPHASAERVKQALSRLESREAERKLVETRRLVGGGPAITRP